MKYLKIHTLEKGWRDRDSIMLHAAFQIFEDVPDSDCKRMVEPDKKKYAAYQASNPF